MHGKKRAREDVHGWGNNGYTGGRYYEICKEKEEINSFYVNVNGRKKVGCHSVQHEGEGKDGQRGGLWMWK